MLAHIKIKLCFISKNSYTIIQSCDFDLACFPKLAYCLKAVGHSFQKIYDVLWSTDALQCIITVQRHRHSGNLKEDTSHLITLALLTLAGIYRRIKNVSKLTLIKLYMQYYGYHKSPWQQYFLFIDSVSQSTTKVIPLILRIHKCIFVQ